jgi:polygalacturonase
VATETAALSGSPCNVRAYGAVGDGVTSDTLALNRAVEACARSGGGTVYVPAATYLTGSVQLQSNVTLWIAPGATILGSMEPQDGSRVQR